MMSCSDVFTSSNRRWIGRCAVCFIALSGAVSIGDDTKFEQVADVLVRRCLECHSDRDPAGSLPLTRLESLLKGGDSGPAITLNQPPKESLLITRVRSGEMPPPQKGQPRPLPDHEVKILEGWIAAGAKWPEKRVLDPYERTTDVRGGRDFWSLQPIRQPEVPLVKNKTRVANPIDAFILARLEKEQISPAPLADRTTMIRRLSFDLIGLPPTSDEVNAYVNDPRSDALVESDLVERLLNSPHFGERWARQWLDLARFAETSGYERDQEKPFAWRYRDWVVQAANSDMPFNQFVLEQVAGDEIPDRTEASVIATGFLRLGTWNDEPNDPEEYKYDRLEDMVNATCTSFLGLTVKCARCHDHKFDPILQSDYYKIAAAFWAGPIEARKRELLGGPSKDELGFDVLGWTDLSANPPELRVLKKGDPKRPLGAVAAGTPTIVASLEQTAPVPTADARTSGRRLQLAQWIINPANPLTARVFVNRLWQAHFGKGIVRSSDNFGFTGDRPTHPELLDWLASEFVRNGWSPKHLHRLLVTSNTYRQTSLHPDAATIEKIDAGNQFWWRYDRHRLDAEQIRDRMLAASGSLDLRMGGPSFKSSVSADALEGLSMKGNAWTASPPEEQRRRSLYMYSKRGLLPPLMTTFDFVDTTLPCGQREVSTVAPQALALMNNQFVHEQSTLMAARVASTAGDADEARIKATWQAALGRLPSAKEITLAKSHLAAQTHRFANQQATRPLPASQVLDVGLSLRLRAGDGVEVDSDGRVVRWRDLSGAEHDAVQSDRDRRPVLSTEGINGQPVIRFDGQRRFLELTGQILTSQQFALLAVVRDAGQQGHRTLFSNWDGKAGNSVTSLFLGSTSESAVRLSDDFAGVGRVQSPREPYLLTGLSTAHDATIYQNLAELARKNGPLATRNLTTAYVLGQQGNIDGEYWKGDLAELLVFNRPLSDAERIAVSRDLAERYGLWNLDTDSTPSPRQLALASLCHVLLNSNEFVYVD